MADVATVAVLIPVFNGHEALLRTLSSISEPFPVDLIIVDDGSDPPVELSSTFNGNSVTLLRLDRNQGITRALNYGLDYILERNYQFVARLDVGDFNVPGRFAKQLSYLTDHPELWLVGSNAVIVDSEGRILYLFRTPTDPETLSGRMHLNSCFLHSTVMFRSIGFRELGIYSDAYPAAEDYELFFRFVRARRAGIVPDVLVSCVVDPNGISIRKRRQQLKTRLRIQLKYFELRTFSSYVGVLKTIGLMVIPYTWILFLKRLGSPSKSNAEHHLFE